MINLEKKLMEFSLRLIDEKKAKIIVPVTPETGYWFGGGNMIEDKEGNLYISGRYRNSGDSRTGLDLGDRGAELAIFKSSDKGNTWTKIKSILKKELPRGVLSIEGTALRFNKDNEVELYISSEKSENKYPDHLKEYLKPGTGVWDIDVIVADKIENLSASNVKELIKGEDSRFIHLKDPFVYDSYNGEKYLMFCTHPYNWTSSNTGYMLRRGEKLNFEAPVFYFFEKGHTWDIAMTRGTCVVDMPQIGVLKNKRISLFFYDGGECVRNLDEHEKAVKRPRGYSCEELGGVAYIENGSFAHIERISKELPLFVSPYGTGCSRYVDVLRTKDGMYATWQQSQDNKSQPLVMNFLSNAEIEDILK
ncbi:sialidase family protein [Brachyspira hyodysenteriae]|uniref:sialidase family protein n=1 Tax=Brachyspira hyodysenteriae TaxID=159 RepID=UPI00063DAE02|nr:sialidase family protein [Brachyspira hyodysenteriae]KLI43867.1 hypothetical protein SZ52_02965 [Brachyspira hyodysenteriae]MDA0079386.1 glycoside hydrolase [Brachyspira hyodysenteriae]QTM07397.1 exo-alpha-sialidase [Brachyspira hyodysenteriae]